MVTDRATSPITIELTQRPGFASFTNREHPGNRIGYRFFEHSPMVYGDTPLMETASDAGAARVGADVSEYINRPNVRIQQETIRYQQGWIDQDWTFYMAPTLDGVDLLWVIETHDRGLPRYYGVQQCFRLGGRGNARWRRAIAETPAFSEYDVWEAQQDRPEKTSLTWVVRNERWQALPPSQACVGARTPLGVQVDRERFAGQLPDDVGPYQARMQAPVDSGLITRTDLEHTWVCGIYWERTSHVSDHHPADCLHAIVDIGNIPPKSRRAVRGKIYWFQCAPSDLLRRWDRDFGTHD